MNRKCNFFCVLPIKNSLQSTYNFTIDYEGLIFCKGASLFLQCHQSLRLIIHSSLSLLRYLHRELEYEEDYYEKTIVS